VVYYDETPVEGNTKDKKASVADQTVADRPQSQKDRTCTEYV